MKYFKGKGYSEEFVSNFNEVIRKLQDNPIVKVIDSIDVICGSCPYNYNNKCIKKGPYSEGKVKRKDNIIIEHLGIELDQELRFLDIKNLVDTNLEKVKEICQECEWREYCD